METKRKLNHIPPDASLWPIALGHYHYLLKTISDYVRVLLSRQCKTQKSHHVKIWQQKMKQRIDIGINAVLVSALMISGVAKNMSKCGYTTARYPRVQGWLAGWASPGWSLMTRHIAGGCRECMHSVRSAISKGNGIGGYYLISMQFCWDLFVKA